MSQLYTKIENYIAHCDNGDILEIGMDRGEASTQFFIDLAEKRNCDYVGVDIEPKNFSGDHVEIHQCTGEHYLSNTNRKFSIVYLDNFDWNYWGPTNDSPIKYQKPAYLRYMKTKLTNINSQKSHLLQAILLTDLLTANATIQCDDTWWLEDHCCWMGKCSSAIPYLEHIGFRVVHHEGTANKIPSTVILARKHEAN